MPSDYLEYWGLAKAPFSLTPDPDMLFLSSQHSECLMRLKYAIFSQKGGSLLVSDNAGNGKTSVLARLKRDLDDYYGGRVRVVFIDHPTLTPIEMIGEIAHQLGAELNTTEKIRALNFLRDRLFTLYNENVKVVVIVDEGQMLKDRPDILGELRILLNFCVADAFLLTFIFSGQKPLDSVLREMPEFWQRLPVRFFLRNLDYHDTRGLIKFRMEQAGGDFNVFTEDALEAIYQYSDGCPRIICSVADLCLVIGYTNGAKRIGFVESTTACRDMDSTGDGYHYYAFVKSHPSRRTARPSPPPGEVPQSVQPRSQNPAGSPRNPEPRPQPHEPVQGSGQMPSAPPEDSGDAGGRPGAAPHPASDMPADDSGDPGRDLPISDVVYCPSCSAANPAEMKFCFSCNTPLYRKCPACQALSDTVSGVCPSCQADIDAAERELALTLKRDLAQYDVLEGGHGVWLNAVGIEIADGEQVAAVFPRGNIVTSGPSIVMSKTSMRSSGDPCDFVVTDRRLIIGSGREQVSLEIISIDSCLVTTAKKLFSKTPVLVVGYEEELYKITLPYGAKKSRAILETISTYIQTRMLK